MATLVGLLLLALLTVGCGGGGGRVRIAVDPAVSLIDAPVDIQVSGLSPGRRVTVGASMRDVHGVRWSSSATYVATGDGTVDVRRARSLGGSYRGTHEMGLFWSMRPSGRHIGLLRPAPGPNRVTLTASVDGQTRARRRIVRRTASPGIRTIRLRPPESGLYGDFYRPPGHGRRAAVLVLGGSEGGLQTSQQAALLASHGHPASRERRCRRQRLRVEGPEPVGPGFGLEESAGALACLGGAVRHRSLCVR